MRKLLMNLVLLGFTQIVLSQVGCHGIPDLTENLRAETILSDVIEKPIFGSGYFGRFEESRSGGDFQIVISGLDVRYSDLMNLYKGKSLQLVRDIDSGQVFWTPSQSVLRKPFENDVFS